MFKVDIHTHVIPHNLNNITKNFTDMRFLTLKEITKNSIKLYTNGEYFRTIKCNCWEAKSRIIDMKKTNVSLQVLSPIPILFSYWAKSKECELLSRYVNDYISNIINKYPNKYLGLGTVPMQNIDKAIKEMDRCIKSLNLNGIEIGSNINGDNLSFKKYNPIFEHAEKINCPIFIHPWNMIGQNEMKKYWLPWLVSMPAEISRAICSLIFGGVLEKYPNLKIAFAHGGGSFPFTLGRIDKGFISRPDLCAIDNQRIPSEYVNFFYVDSLVHSKKALDYIIDIYGCNRIALGSDYPFPLGEEYPGSLIDNLKITKTQKQQLFYKTAFDWLGIDEKKYI